MEPRFLEFITNNITSRKETELSKVKETTVQDVRMSLFLANVDKDSPIFNEFANGGYKETRQEFMNTLAVELSDVPFEERINAYADLIAGIQIAYVSDYEEAIDVEDVLTVIVEDADLAMTMRIASLASSKILEEYYEVGE